MIIALARLTTDLVADGNPFAADLGRRPTLIEQKRAEALIWLLDGSQDDVDAALGHASRIGDGWRVLTFPASVDEPVELAKLELLGQAGKPAIGCRCPQCWGALDALAICVLCDEQA